MSDSVERTAKAMVEEAPEPDVTERCVECGRSRSGACGCCGAPLCFMHEETQAGLCSNFSTYEFSQGQRLIVTDQVLELRRAKIKFTEDVEVTGCLEEYGDPGDTDFLIPFANLQKGEEGPVSKLDEEKFEVVKED